MCYYISRILKGRNEKILEKAKPTLQLFDTAIQYRAYRIQKRDDYWARKWLAEDKVNEPKNFFDLDEVSVICIRRAAGIAYNFINGQGETQHCRGTVLQRRGPKLRVKCGNEIHIIFLFAARKDWGNYYRKTAGRYLKILNKKLMAMRPEVKTVIQFFDALKDSQYLQCTETSFYIRLCDAIKKQKLTEKESAFIHKYYEVLKRAQNTIFQN